MLNKVKTVFCYVICADYFKRCTLHHFDKIILLFLTSVPKPIFNSFYGEPNRVIHLQNVSCLGDESDLSECTKTQLSFPAGKELLNKTEVAGVDCIYDEPTPPPCIVNPDIDLNDSCSSKGSIIRLMKNGVESTNEGGLEYCNGEFWTPLCSMDNRAAAVACGELGHTRYQCKIQYEM